MKGANKIVKLCEYAGGSPAWDAPGTFAILTYISNGGAKVVIERGHPPEEFDLYISLHGIPEMQSPPAKTK